MKIGVWSPILRLFAAKKNNSFAEFSGDILKVSYGTVVQNIPLDDIENANLSQWPWYGGVGWRVGPQTLGLIGALSGIVEIKLKKRRKTNVWYLPVKYNKIFISLQEPEAFLEMLLKR